MNNLLLWLSKFYYHSVFLHIKISLLDHNFQVPKNLAVLSSKDIQFSNAK